MHILEFPEFRQTFDYDCGAKSLEAILAYYGINANEIDLINLAGTNDDHGTPINGIKKVARHFGFKVAIKAMTIAEIKKYLDQDKPVLLMLQAWSKQKIKNWKKHWDHGHFVVAVGYDKDKIYFEDPYVNVKTYLTYKELLQRWHDIDTRSQIKYNNLGILFYGKRKKYSANKIIHMD